LRRAKDMSETVDTIEYKGYTINIKHDCDAESPRVWDNLGKMICFHRSYELGDKHDYKTDHFEGWDEIREHLIKEEGALLISELYLYDHTTQHIKIGSWHGLLSQGHAEFDSGCVGFIYANKEMILTCYGGEKITKAKLKREQKGLEGEVKVYNSWVEGSCYGWTVDDPGGEEIDDSCWGYYGCKWDENGIREARENAIDCEIVDREKEREKARLRRVNKAKALVRHRVPLERRWA